jgi:hypothetical protein
MEVAFQADCDLADRYIPMNISERQRLIALQPLPRMVRLSRRGKSWVLLLASVLATVEAGLVIYLVSRWIKANSLTTVVSTYGLAFYSALFLPFLPVFFSRGLGKEKELVRNGKVAIATVTSTSNSPSKVNRNDDVRTVQFQFRDGSGTIVEGTSVDSTLLLREQSAMLVFYRAGDPTQHVAQCAAYYQVMVPGLDSDWLDDVG